MPLTSSPSLYPSVATARPPPATVAKVASPSLDFFFGLDKGLVPPWAIMVKYLVPKKLPILENIQVEVPPRPELEKEDQR